ncbi:hypothetical protein DPMN_086344 [Dreissena polymorpha]|uniref:Uncharacterized protein n=1 Tax=Dreissena polymorpha TaxID=45954 RepID=A0A9D4QV35_DREPO|nr:hypothetical protein DPMN_086344 [Dreissena polymorpha]
MSPDVPRPLETQCCPNITCLSILGDNTPFDVNHVKSKSLSQSLASLIRLTTLCIRARQGCKEPWKALHGLNIKRLNMSVSGIGVMQGNQPLIAQSLSSLSQLDTFTLYVHSWIDIKLPLSLKYLNINCDEMSLFVSRKIMNTLSACTQRVGIKFEFGVKIELSQSIEIYRQQLETPTNVEMTRFLIFRWKPSIGRGSEWCVQEVVVGVDGNHDDDIGGDKLYKQFIDDVAELHRFSMRFRIN